MKKKLPFILLGAGVLVLLLVFVFTRITGSNSTASNDPEGGREVAFKDRPVVALIPTADGHYLKLKVDKFSNLKATTMDYELLYDTADEITQGVPGTVELEGKDTYENDLLLGSESSGKFRYDEGVEKGSITLRFRDQNGKLLSKFESDFRLLSNTNTLESADGKFVYKTDSEKPNGFFVVMDLIGAERDLPKKGAPAYTLYASSGNGIGGNVSIEGTTEIQGLQNGKWEKLQGNKSSTILQGYTGL